ncbi:hypothetical protein HKX48_000769, partial [Thoreauomyces humboldtii]
MTSTPPPPEDDGGPHGSPSPRSKAAWNLNAPSYVPLQGEPSQAYTPKQQQQQQHHPHSQQPQVHLPQYPQQRYDVRRGPNGVGNDMSRRGGSFSNARGGRGGGVRTNVRGGNQRAMINGYYPPGQPGSYTPTVPHYGRRFPRHSPHGLPQPGYYGMPPPTDLQHLSPDPRAIHTDAVYLTGSASPGRDQENMPFGCIDTYDQFSQDVPDFPLTAENDSDLHSMPDSYTTSSDYTLANSSFTCMDSLATQSTRGGGSKAGDRNFQRPMKQSSPMAIPMSAQAALNSEERRMEQRQKQIDYGKNTTGYQRYIQMVPRHRRKRTDPETPKKETRCSKRCWDGLIRQWRRELHVWDPPEMTEKHMPEWELPSMAEARSATGRIPLVETMRQTHRVDGPAPTPPPDYGYAPPPRTHVPSRNLFEEALTTPSGHSELFPAWSDFSLEELDQKFARKMRPNETFEGFGMSPPKRTVDPDYSWAHCSIDQLDEKFGHKLRISEAVDFSWGPLTTSTISPFTPSPRSKLFPSPFGNGDSPVTPIAPPKRTSISPITKLNVASLPVRASPS